MKSHVVQLWRKHIANGSQPAVSKSFYYLLLHHYSLSGSQHCTNEIVAWKTKMISKTCNEKDMVNTEHTEQ